LDTDATTPDAGTASDTASDFKIVDVTQDKGFRCPSITYHYNGRDHPPGLDAIIYKRSKEEGRYYLPPADREEIKEAGIRYREEHGLLPWPEIGDPIPKSERKELKKHDAPEQLHEARRPAVNVPTSTAPKLQDVELLGEPYEGNSGPLIKVHFLADKKDHIVSLLDFEAEVLQYGGMASRSILQKVRDWSKPYLSKVNAKGSTKADEKQSVALRLVELGRQDGNSEFFHDRTGTVYARVMREGYHKVMAVRGPEFEGWLTGLAYDADNLAPDGATLERAINTLSVIASRGEEREVFLRHGTDGEAIYYDLCNGKGEAVRITSKGWEIVTDPPVMFLQSEHMLPQVTPIPRARVFKPGPGPGEDDPDRENINDLEKLIELANLPPDGKDVLSVHIPSLCIPGISLMGAVTVGPQGSGKTTTQVLASRLCDPSTDDKSSIPAKGTDLGLYLSTHRLATFDNVSHLTGEQSDILSRAGTGGSDTARALWTNNGINRRTYKAPTIMNAITLTGAKPDFFDRVIVYTTQDDFENGIIGDTEMEQFIRDKLPYALGRMFDQIQGALLYRELGEIEAPEWVPRMADWYMWALALAKANGKNDGWLRERLEPMLNQRNYDSIAEDPLTVVLEYIAQNKGFMGTPRELFDHINDPHKNILFDAGVDSKGKDWPKDPATFGKRITRMLRPLASHGVHIRRYLWHQIEPYADKIKDQDGEALYRAKHWSKGGKSPYVRSERIIILSNAQIDIEI